MTDRDATMDCPKHMVFGPCGGVTDDARCEVDRRPCPFVSATLPQPDTEHRPRPVDLGRVVVDCRLPHDDATLDEVAAVYRDIDATLLIGEHVDDPHDAEPHHHAERLASRDLRAIVTVTGRRRTADEHAAEIRRLVDAGVAAVHCVTGDHPAVRFGADATADFTLDGVRLASLARVAGAHVSVAESPAAPPRAERASRVASKQRAGADVGILNHAGPTGALVDFAAACRRAGADLALVAPVPVITDVSSARALAQFPGLALPDGLMGRILDADDPRRTGIRLAAELADELAASGRFTALNLSGSGTAGGPVERAQVMAEVVALLGC